MKNKMTILMCAIASIGIMSATIATAADATAPATTSHVEHHTEAKAAPHDMEKMNVKK